jgi:hypothetical protein
MMRVLWAFVLLISLASDTSALNMNWVLDENEKLAYLNLWGSIVPGDDEQFRSVVTPLLKRGYIVFKVNIFTGGGNVAAAKGISDQIRTLQTRTVAPYIMADIIDDQKVPRDYPSCFFSTSNGIDNVVHGTTYNWCTCASACFLIWASGIVREGRHVGVHRIYWLNEAGKQFGAKPGPAGREQYLREQRDFQDYLDSLDVPRNISDRLWVTPSDSMHYLTQEELELMWSTPYLEEQTRARCGPDRTEHMSQENNWTATFDNQHAQCYRGLLKEFMRDGAAAYLVKYAPGTVANPSTPTPGVGGPFVPINPQRTETEPRGDTYWDHNGSQMYLISDGSNRKFLYQKPRAELNPLGVQTGTLLFEGRRQGARYFGIAYAFSARCGNVTYKVEGNVSSDDREVTLYGKKPIMDAQCNISEYVNDKLIFTYHGQ